MNHLWEILIGVGVELVLAWLALLMALLVARAAGEEPIRRHWPGTSTGCEALLRLTRTRRRVASQPDLAGGPGD